MQHEGNRVVFTADEIDQYTVNTDGDLTVFLVDDARIDTARNIDDQPTDFYDEEDSEVPDDSVTDDDTERLDEVKTKTKKS